MFIFFIFGLLLGAVTVVFVLQNVDIITVTFLSWQLTGSMALILSLTIASGMLIAILLFLPEFIDNYFKFRRLQKENKKLEEELKKINQTPLEDVLDTIL